MRIPAGVVLVVLATLGQGHARGEETADANRLEADALTREGTSHFRLREFDAALKVYKDAYRIAPRPELLFNIAQCYRYLDQKQAAVDSFKNFLQASTDEAQKGPVRGLVLKLEAAIRQDVATKSSAPPVQPVLGRALITTKPEGATVRFDGDEKARNETTPAEFGNLAVGRRRVVIAKGGFLSVTQIVDVEANKTANIDVQLTHASPEAALSRPALAKDDRRRHAPVYKRWWFWAALGAVAVVGVGVGLGVGLSSGPSAPSATTSAGTFRF